MPKRDVAYMEGQREQIARAALETMLEKGFCETSLRDVCKTAGVSIGALYIHFANKEELFLAASRLPYGLVDGAESDGPDDNIKTWADYRATILSLKDYLTSERGQRRFRLSLQFTADQAVGKVSPYIDPLFQAYSATFSDTLQRLFDNGEIEIPMGLEATTQAHYSLVIGTIYTLSLSRNMDIDRALEALLSSLELTAGRK